MKKIIFMCAAALMFLAGCEKHNGTTTTDPEIPAICNEWKSTELPVDAMTYLVFNEDGGFELYQNMKGSGYELYRGKWNIEGDALSGTYNDNEPWACQYRFEVVKGAEEGAPDTLKLTAVSDDGLVSTYVSCEIPDVIRETSTVVVKSGSSGQPVL